MLVYKEIKKSLLSNQHTWLITGVAGFIGSNILETLLNLDQKVVGLDNFMTGNEENLLKVKNSITNKKNWKNFKFIKGDICNIDDCKSACNGVEFVLHQAALGSVPRSLKDPALTNQCNIDGFLNMLIAAKDSDVISFTYAASSSTYGDHIDLPKIESNIGNPLSPYAVTKYVNELYADVFARNYNFKSIGLRYFNIFGPRQDPHGAYAAVIPIWIRSMIENQIIYINGNGDTSRDFTFVENAVQANILAAVAKDEFKNEVYNVACGSRISLLEMFHLLRDSINSHGLNYLKEPQFRDYRKGDVLHSLAEIKKAKIKLGYVPSHDFKSGIASTIEWFLKEK